jgi:hypothetical protein
MFRNQLVTITIHSDHGQEPTVVEIPGSTDDVVDSGSPCFFVKSGQMHVFLFNESFQNTAILQLWIYTTGN